ncbi:MAG: cytochrome c [Planctomycetes bacterium]|nr:cytochrome c [Planctomycetota bacterium]
MKTKHAIKLTSLACAAFCLALSAFMMDQPAHAQDAIGAGGVEAKSGDSATAQAESDGSKTSDSGLEHPGLKPFKSSCAGCHSIGGGDLAGPDLAGLKNRMPDESWFAKFLKDPGGMIEAGGYAKEMAAKYDSIMPPQGHLSDEVIADLMDFILRGGPGMEVKKLKIDMSAANIERGRQYFTGELGFDSGAPACIACHTTNDLGGLGGGNMAGFQSPDKANLSNAHARMGGDRGTAAMLASPQFLVMRDVYSRQPLNDAEINALTAYFADQSRRADAPKSSGNFFILYGLIGAAVLLVLLDVAWLKRFRAVRKPLVDGRA